MVGDALKENHAKLEEKHIKLEKESKELQKHNTVGKETHT